MFMTGVLFTVRGAQVYLCSVEILPLFMFCGDIAPFYVLWRYCPFLSSWRYCPFLCSVEILPLFIFCGDIAPFHAL